MNPSEWALLVAFGAALWGISLVSPEGAVMLGGFVALVMVVESGALDRVKTLIGGK